MTKLLVVDDSPLIRRLLGALFEAEGDFEVAFARNGLEALEVLQTFQPDVITLDVQMPEMDGLECLDRIMVERPTPVVMASSLTAEGAAEALKALELGAVDFIAKPSGAISLRMDDFGPPLVEKVRAAAAVRVSKARRLRERVSGQVAARIAPRRPAKRRTAPPSGLSEREGLVLVGSSTGGPPALDLLLGGLPPDFPWPIVIAQHMPATFTGALAKRLDGLAELSVVEVREPTLLVPGTAYVGRGDADVIVSRRRGRLHAVSVPASGAYRWHPSVDRLVASALEVIETPSGVVGVLLTGMGADGAQEMARLKQGGGHTIAESEDSAVVWGMPRALVELGGASEIAPIQEIAARLIRAVAS